MSSASSVSNRKKSTTPHESTASAKRDERSSQNNKDQNQYDDDLSQTGSLSQKKDATNNNNNNSAPISTHQSIAKNETEVSQKSQSSAYKAPSVRKVHIEDEDDEAKSTLSEISEQLIADTIDKNEKEDEENEKEETETRIVLNKTDDEEEDSSRKDHEDLAAKLTELIQDQEDKEKSSSSSSSESSSSSRPTSGLIKPVVVVPIKVGHLVDTIIEEKPESPTGVAPSPPQNEKIADKIENLLLSQAIDQIIEVRDRKLVRMGEGESLAGKRLEITVEESTSLKIESQRTPQIPPIDLFAEAEEVKKPPPFNIPYNKEKVIALCDMAIEGYYWKNLNNLKSLLEENYAADIDDSNEIVAHTDLAGYFKSSVDTAHCEEEERQRKLQSEMHFKRMLLDLIGELFYDLYLERFEEDEVINEFVPCLRKRAEKKYFKSMPKGPGELMRAKLLVRNKVLSLIKLQTGEEAEAEAGMVRGVFRAKKQLAKSKWKVMKKLDLVDTLLDREMREQEFEWSNYDIEEYEAKLLVSNTVFDMLLKDTIDSLRGAIAKKKINLIN